MDKYISVELPSKNNNGSHIYWWNPDMLIQGIEILEAKNPKYNFFQIVSTGNNGGTIDYALMKIKNEQTIKNNEVQLVETEKE